MSDTGEFCCGKCLFYNGDMSDKQAFCDEREDYVSRGFYCYRYIEVEDFSYIRTAKGEKE